MESTRNDISFFTRGLYTDVEFLVGNYSHVPRRIRAHKLLLAMRNEVFEVMFYGDLPEENEIRITDLHPDGFLGFLKYLYSQRAIFDSLEQAMQTRAAAQKYLETKLVNACDEFIQNSLQPSNVCKVLDYVIKEGDLGTLDDIIDEFLAHEAGLRHATHMRLASLHPTREARGRLRTAATGQLDRRCKDALCFRYVLTRCLNSDPVESLFSCFRQFNGGNDKVDARTAVFTAERFLKVGIIEAAKSENAPTSCDAQTSVRSSAPQRPDDNLPPVIEMAARRLMRELRSPDVCDQVSESLKLAPLAYLAGYIALACDEKHAAVGQTRAQIAASAREDLPVAPPVTLSSALTSNAANNATSSVSSSGGRLGRPEKGARRKRIQRPWLNSTVISGSMTVGAAV
ncbi:putative topoisomerase TOP1-interacting protein BTBD1 [Ixodes scapularis]